VASAGSSVEVLRVIRENQALRSTRKSHHRHPSVFLFRLPRPVWGAVLLSLQQRAVCGLLSAVDGNSGLRRSIRRPDVELEKNFSVAPASYCAAVSVWPRSFYRFSKGGSFPLARPGIFKR
jgi:hypothetical protein